MNPITADANLIIVVTEPHSTLNQAKAGTGILDVTLSTISLTQGDLWTPHPHTYR